MSASPVTIGIAIVESAGRYLVGRRGEGGPLVGCWEFPGGKCHAGEWPADCAVRECREETGLTVRAVAEFARVRHAYPHGDVDLHFWLCEPVADGDVSESHNGYEWIAVQELQSLNFPEANTSVLQRLRQRQ